MYYKKMTDSNGKPYLEVSLSDYPLVGNPLLNKGMGFNDEERRTFSLLGLLPPHQATLEEQRDRSYEVLKSKETDLEKYLYLSDLQNSNETLYYSLLVEHIAEIMPIVYTPTVGLGCQKLSHIYRRPRGLYIAYPYKDRIDEILAHPRFDNVEAIVVSDGERILGLGDQGAGGMGIPIGKLALYSGCAGIHPEATLPILLDTGTNNPDLIKDPLYIGWRHERVRGKEYDAFIEAFVKAVKKRFPHVLLQWEDFAQQNAYPILEKYRDQLCTFNDDIQGTAAIATGTLLAAVKATRGHIRDKKVVVVGGGSAGCGISNLIMHAMMEDGLSEADARARFFVIDRNGLLTDNMELLPFQKPFAHPTSILDKWQLEKPGQALLFDAIKNVKPDILIGVSGQPGIFTEQIVKEMASHVDRPIILPLSNPTSRSEATPTDILKWTNEKAIMGTGSPFDPVMKQGKPFRIDQTNNCYIFPGMGLGLIAVKATKVTDKMFMVAARALAECSPAAKDPEANLLPSQSEVRAVSLQVGIAVAKEAVRAGLAPKHTDAEVEKLVKDKMWTPAYLPYQYKPS